MAKSHIGKFLSYLLNKQTDWNQWIGFMIEYKGYLGWFEFDKKTNLFLGRVANTDTLITFQGTSVKKVKVAFKKSVKKYILLCKKNGKNPEKHSKIDFENIKFLHNP
jgi:hypothetical protein